MPLTTDTSPQVRVVFQPLREAPGGGLLRASNYKGWQAPIARGPPLFVPDTVARVDFDGSALRTDDAPRRAVTRRGGSVAGRNLERRPRPRVDLRVVRCEDHDEYGRERRGEAARLIARVAVLLWPRRPRVVGYDAAEHDAAAAALEVRVFVMEAHALRGAVGRRRRFAGLPLIVPDCSKVTGSSSTSRTAAGLQI